MVCAAGAAAAVVVELAIVGPPALAGAGVFDDPPQPAACSSVEAAKTAARRTMDSLSKEPDPRATAPRYGAGTAATAGLSRIVTEANPNGRLASGTCHLLLIELPEINVGCRCVDGWRAPCPRR